MTDYADPTYNDKSDGRSTGRVLSDILQSLTGLMRGEIALVKSELQDSLRAAVRGVVFLLVAVALGVAALGVLTSALIAALIAAGLTPLWANLVVGLAFLLLAFGFARYGLSLVSPSNLTPKRSMQNLQRDAETLKDVVNKDATQ